MKAQSGNVIIYVLIAVGLLAALAYVVANNSRGSGYASKEQVSLSATEVLEFTNNLSNAVAQLRLRGCQESEVSFDNSVDAAIYDNVFAPVDGSCDVFGVNGGGLQYNQTLSFFLTGEYVISNVGSSNPDLIVDVDVSKDVCQALNNSVDINNNGVEGPPSDALVGGGAFDGGFVAVSGANGRTDDPQFSGKLSACRHDSGGGGASVFKYYRVLMAR